MATTNYEHLFAYTPYRARDRMGISTTADAAYA